MEFQPNAHTDDLDFNESESHGYIGALREYISRQGQLCVDCIGFGTHFCVFTDRDIDTDLLTLWECGMSSLHGNYNDGEKTMDDKAYHVEKIATEVGKIKKISIGEMHCLLLCEDGKVYSLGRGTSGELGLGVPISFQKQPSLINMDKDIIDVSAGSHYSIFVACDGTVYTCGNGAYCRLGHTIGSNDENDNIQIPTIIDTLQGIHVTRCFAGTWHAMVAVDSTGDVLAWGWNKFGQIGNNSGNIQPQPKRLQCFDFLLLTKDEKGKEIDFKIHDIVLGSYCSLIAITLSTGKTCVFIFGIDEDKKSMSNLPLDFDDNNTSDHQHEDGGQFGYDYTDVLYHRHSLCPPVYMNIADPSDQVILMW